LLALKGTPLPQDAALDELRLKDVPTTGAELKPGQRLDPLLHYAGRTEVHFGDNSSVTQNIAAGLIDHAARQVTSTHRQLQLDYGQGLLTINAPKAQGLSGNLKSAGETSLADIAIESDLDLAHIILVSLDDLPIRSSQKMLLQ